MPLRQQVDHRGDGQIMSCTDESPGHTADDHGYVTDEAVMLHDIRSLLRAILAAVTVAPSALERGGDVPTVADERARVSVQGTRPVWR